MLISLFLPAMTSNAAKTTGHFAFAIIVLQKAIYSAKLTFLSLLQIEKAPLSIKRRRWGWTQKYSAHFLASPCAKVNRKLFAPARFAVLSQSAGDVLPAKYRITSVYSVWIALISYSWQ